MILVLLLSLGLTDDLTPPRLEHEPCAAFQKGQPFTIIARIYDESPIFDPKVHYKIENDPKWKSIAFAKDPASDDFKATIRSNELRGALLYFIEAFDENGNGPTQLGTPETPIRVTPADRAPTCKQVGNGPEPTVVATKPSGNGEPTPAPDPMLVVTPPPAEGGCGDEPAPWYCSGLVWGGVAGGVLAVGLGAGVIYWLVSGSEERPVGRRTEVTLDVVGTSPTSALELGRRIR